MKMKLIIALVVCVGAGGFVAAQPTSPSPTLAQLADKLAAQEEEIGELKQQQLIDEETISNLIGEYQRLDGWLSQSTDSRIQLKPER